jgi:eukaryotic-like serine/threonine-protein kinase
MVLSPGARLGPYEILSVIGAGGMGEVYRARDTRLDRVVAIKRVLGSLAGDQDLRARFQHEARTIAALNHPHICTIHDVGHEDGIDYLVMEHLAARRLPSASRVEGSQSTKPFARRSKSRRHSIARIAPESFIVT